MCCLPGALIDELNDERYDVQLDVEISESLMRHFQEHLNLRYGHRSACFCVACPRPLALQQAPVEDREPSFHYRLGNTFASYSIIAGRATVTRACYYVNFSSMKGHHPLSTLGRSEQCNGMINCRLVI